MTLRNKVFLCVGLSAFVFLALDFLLPIHHSPLIFASLSILFFSINSSLTYLFMMQKIRKLHEQLKIAASKKIEIEKINKINLEESEVLEFKPSVEIMNEILEKTHASHTLVEEGFKQQIHTYKQRLKEMEVKNALLQQEINTHLVKNNPDPNPECLSQMARYDDLTSLPNRVFFNEILNKAMSHAKRHNLLLAILHIDLDSFSKFSEGIAPIKSGYILKEMSRRFTNVLRSEDVLAKLEGEEFIVLLNDIKKTKFTGMVARKLLQACSLPLKIDANEFIITASIGVCIYPNDGDSLEELLKNGNEALYKAKHVGGNAYQFCAHEMDIEAREYIQLESALRKAIHNSELAIYYQPKLNLKKGHIVGLETLMRWEHPVLGIVNPAKFVALAEESGLIMKIGEWALREACERNKYWQNEGYEHLTISVKLSAHQFRHPEIFNVLEKVLAQTDLSPNYLELEITENTIMSDVTEAADILEKFKKIGVQICIDHFGTGYTSISYLKKFPINFIKIDKDYIRGVPNNPNDSAITSAIIALAHNLGLGVISEGVETAEQVQFLANQQCDIIQGYFLSHPVSAQKIQLQLTKLRDEVLI